MLSIMIDAHEERDIATAIIVQAYLHADLGNFTLLKVEGESVDTMCRVNEKYIRFVMCKIGKKVLYLRLLKALYECVKSALPWYKLFSGTLQGNSFE